jgi:hypothetical protein
MYTKRKRGRPKSQNQSSGGRPNSQNKSSDVAPTELRSNTDNGNTRRSKRLKNSMEKHDTGKYTP